MAQILLDLTELSSGRYHQLSPARGLNLAHAAGVCLENQGHPLEVLAKGEGAYIGEYMLKRYHTSDEIRRSWADLQEATEQGACGIALLQIFEETIYQVVERSKKGTGIDYWLGEKNTFLFQKKARLEVSGTLEGNKNELKRRLNEKLNQTKQSDEKLLPAIIVIVGFNKPTILTGARL